jgi:hypothetical protein
MRDCRLQRIEAIVQGEQRMLTEGHDNSLIFDR